MYILTLTWFPAVLKYSLQVGGIRHSKTGHPKNFFFDNSFVLLFLGAKLANEEKSSSVVCLVFLERALIAKELLILAKIGQNGLFYENF